MLLIKVACPPPHSMLRMEQRKVTQQSIHTISTPPSSPSVSMSHLPSDTCRGPSSYSGAGDCTKDRRRSLGKSQGAHQTSYHPRKARTYHKMTPPIEPPVLPFPPSAHSNGARLLLQRKYTAHGLGYTLRNNTECLKGHPLRRIYSHGRSAVSYNTYTSHHLSHSNLDDGGPHEMPWFGQRVFPPAGEAPRGTVPHICAIAVEAHTTRPQGHLLVSAVPGKQYRVFIQRSSSE